MLRESTLGADEATALVITDTQQAGLQPPKYAFAPPQKSRHPCRSCTSSFDISVEQQLSSEPERQTDIHLNPKGQTKCDSWSSSKPRKTPKKKAHPPIPSSWPTFNDELAKAGVLLAYEGLHPSFKGARVHFSGKNRHRRPLRRNQGTRRRLLALAGQVSRRPGGSLCRSRLRGGWDSA